VGAVLGTWLAALPAALLLLVLGAWLLPGYYRRQRDGDTDASLFRPGTSTFRRVLAVRFATALAIATGALVAALPGLAFLLVAGATDDRHLARVGVIFLFGGALWGWLYVHLGLLFADRDAVFGESTMRRALAGSWRRARGRRLARLRLAAIAWLVEVLGSLGWVAWFVGFVTHPLARTVSDAMLTRFYFAEVADA
jgi:hypothetical protein